jgi:hypothetical protein
MYADDLLRRRRSSTRPGRQRGHGTSIDVQKSRRARQALVMTDDRGVLLSTFVEIW